MRLSGIGGQAVIEGVMMKNKNEYAVAVRKPDQEIVVEKSAYKSVKDKYKFLGWPILRGITAFVESMVIGMKTLTFSAGFYEEEEAEPSRMEQAFGKVFKNKAESVIMGLTVIVAIVLAVGIFMILPYFISGLFKSIAPGWLQAVLEGVIRLVIFVAYVAAISLMKDIKRVFMYHGAEHKTINCVENGFKLTVANVRKQSREHKRCGTSFLLYVVILSIIFFSFIRVDAGWLRIVLRILLVPVIAGVAYEFIRLAGSSGSKVIGVLSKPGLWLQKLTTREPDDGMIEVAIKSVESVFDWEGFLAGTDGVSAEASGAVSADKPVKDEKKRIKNRKQEPAQASKQEPVESRPSIPVKEIFDDEAEEEDEEDDEILRALDKYFNFDENKKE